MDRLILRSLLNRDFSESINHCQVLSSAAAPRYAKGMVSAYYENLMKIWREVCWNLQVYLFFHCKLKG